MGFKYFAVLLVISVVNAGVAQSGRSFKGVDPNTLSCDPLGLEFLLLPSFTDCNKFYMCVHGEEVQFACSTPELIFDFEEQECNWPNLGNCILRSHDEGDGSEEGSGDDPGFFEELPGNVNGAIIDCHHIETASKQVPYRGDCQRYWRCASGVPQTVYCSDGLFFNPERQQCDFEANVKCNFNEEDELTGEFIVYKQ